MIPPLLAFAVGCPAPPAGKDPDSQGPTVTVPPVSPVLTCEIKDWYRDRDGDGLGDPTDVRRGCDPPIGYGPAIADCDDSDPKLNQPVDDAHFVDASDAAGLRGIGTSWTGGDPCIHEPLGGGAAAGDIDGDGDIDLFLPRMYLRDLLLRNDGAGRFVADAAFRGSDGASNGASFVDVDGDRDLDLLVTPIGPEPVRLYLNDGTGAFSEEGNARGVALPTSGRCADRFGISAADIDGDGDLDLFIAAWQERDLVGTVDHTRLLRNDGTGHFSDVTVEAGLDVLWQRAAFGGLFWDRDGDGDQDLHLVADWGGTGLFLNDGNGRFREVARSTFTDENGMGADFGDVDNDGDLDWFVSAIWDGSVACPPVWGCTGNRLYADDGGVFVDRTDQAGVRQGQWGWGTSFLDYDLDGNLDLAMTGGMDALYFVSQPGRLWRGRGDGTFEDTTCRSGFVERRLGRGLIPFDADGDGDQDILVTGMGEEPTLWRNTGYEGRRALIIDLDDRRTANRFGVGALVEVQVATGGPVLVRPITANPAYLSGRPPEAWFGLGDAAGAVASLAVRWPDGERIVYPPQGTGRVTLTRP